MSPSQHGKSFAERVRDPLQHPLTALDYVRTCRVLREAPETMDRRAARKAKLPRYWQMCYEHALDALSAMVRQRVFDTGLTRQGESGEMRKLSSVEKDRLRECKACLKDEVQSIFSDLAEYLRIRQAMPSENFDYMREQVEVLVAALDCIVPDVRSGAKNQGKHGRAVA